MEIAVVPARERRLAVQTQASASGIDEDYISLLVDTFYTRVRQHESLGPIFNGVIGERWPEHLARLKAFWSSVALGSGRYSGKPVPVHMALQGIRPEHFTAWLSLFRQTLADTAPSEAAAALFMDRAERIGASLQLALFGLPELASLGGQHAR